MIDKYDLYIATNEAIGSYVAALINLEQMAKEYVRQEMKDNQDVENTDSVENIENVISWFFRNIFNEECTNEVFNDFFDELVKTVNKNKIN